MLLRFKKQQLVDALESRRPWAKKLDAKRKAEHQRAEKRFHELWKSTLKRALSWDYATAKKHHFNVSLDYSTRQTRPECPQGVEVALDRAIAQVEMDGRERYALSDRGGSRYSNDHYTLVWLLTHNENEKADICG